MQTFIVFATALCLAKVAIIEHMASAYANALSKLQEPMAPQGQGISLSRTCNLCWQPLGYALYNRPIRIKSMNESKCLFSCLSGAIPAVAMLLGPLALHWSVC